MISLFNKLDHSHTLKKKLRTHLANIIKIRDKYNIVFDDIEEEISKSFHLFTFDESLNYVERAKLTRESADSLMRGLYLHYVSDPTINEFHRLKKDPEEKRAEYLNIANRLGSMYDVALSQVTKLSKRNNEDDRITIAKIYDIIGSSAVQFPGVLLFQADRGLYRHMLKMGAEYAAIGEWDRHSFLMAGLANSLPRFFQNPYNYSSDKVIKMYDEIAYMYENLFDQYDVNIQSLVARAIKAARSDLLYSIEAGEEF